MNFLVNQDKYVRATEYLKKQIITKDYDWDVARMKPMDGELYANKEIQVGGTQQLLTGASVQERGITNFDGNKLNKGRAFVADGIAFGYAVADAGAAPHTVKFDYDGVPAYLKHANIVLKQKDEVIIKLPINAISNSNGSGSESLYRDLGAFALIEDDAIVDFEIEFPQGVKPNLAAGKSLYVSAYIRGFETYLKR